MNIETRYDSHRGCGWRKPGALYLVSEGPGRECSRLPIPLVVCPTCSCGVKPTRGWTWVNTDVLLAPASTCKADSSYCAACPMAQPMGRAGLLWIGEIFYPTSDAWTREAVRQGVSRRITTVPHGFEVGKTWVLVAHRKAIRNPGREYTPGVFHAFRPQAIEYIVRGNETEAELEALVARGITPVKVIRREGGLLEYIDETARAAA